MIRLGDVRVSIERREVFRHDQPVRLGSRAFDLLECLLAAPQRLLTKDELIEAVWPDTVVEENNLHVQMSSLRKQLALDRDLLETVAGRGYRLNLPVTQIASAKVHPPAVAKADDRSPDSRALATVHIVDDESTVRNGLVRQLRSAGFSALAYASAEAYLSTCSFEDPGCLLLDVRLSQSSGLDLQAELTQRGIKVPIVFMTGFGTIDLSVRAMKAGAVGFITKPFDESALFDSLREALETAHRLHAQAQREDAIRARFATLSPREQEVFGLLVEGRRNKDIALALGLQEVTVKLHKKHIMTKLSTRTLVELVLLGRMAGRLPDSATLDIQSA
ncbi:response regulator [Pseudomonas oryzihabitans]|uniref:response regulator n=1 Tax=Pseudomonas oryzihabitans TaxID=47885 RepID=UPI0011A7A7EE|nr:response regulator [Pseudomonas oryzihabitans]QEU01929.1 response regulator [Pseudomonas oryzihabitans]